MRQFAASLDRLDASLIALAIVTAAGATAVECSNQKPDCGNGVVEPGEQCDKGAQNGMPNSGCSTSCQNQAIEIASVQVFYTRLMDEAPGFGGSSCLDLGVDVAHVVLNGPTHIEERWPCSRNSSLYSNVMPGTYQATITLLDAAGNPITNPVKSTMVEVMAPRMVTLTINFHMADFVKQDYVGTLFFNPKWEKPTQSCAAVTPPVTLEGITLKTHDGEPVNGMTSEGHRLDGTPGSCFSESASTTFESVPSLPWGHYNLTLTGRIGGGSIGYCKTFDVFVGPGVANTTYTLVADPMNADAGTSCL
jgi:cysteine-rich repeat protein